MIIVSVLYPSKSFSTSPIQISVLLSANIVQAIWAPRPTHFGDLIVWLLLTSLDSRVPRLIT